MHQKYKFSPSVKRLISLQDGVVSRSQAVGLSMPASTVKRLIRDEQWRSIVSGIYFVGVAEPSWRAMAWAGILVGGVGSMLTGLAGAYGWGIADKAPEIIDVLVPPNKRTQKDSRTLALRASTDVAESARGFARCSSSRGDSRRM